MSELGITNIVAIEYADKINELAELLGKGPNSLSVLLEDDLGNQYMACHSSAWTVEDYQAFTEPSTLSNLLATLEVNLEEYSEAISQLIWNVVPLTTDYNAISDNWQPILNQLGLHIVAPVVED